MSLALWLSLFGSAFLAATVVPFSSELAVAGAVAAGAGLVSVVLVAGAGNTAGACINWALGSGFERFRERRWFPVSASQLERAQAWFQRFGVWSLLLAWLPVIGDALTVVAGVMRVRFAVFVLLTAVGKTARYAVVVMVLDGAGVGAAH